MINEKYADYAWEQTAALLAIDSPSGFTRRAAEWVKTAFEALGFPAKITTKGGVLADLGGENADDACFWKPTAIPWAQWSPRSRATGVCA